MVIDSFVIALLLLVFLLSSSINNSSINFNVSLIIAILNPGLLNIVSIVLIFLGIKKARSLLRPGPAQQVLFTRLLYTVVLYYHYNSIH